MSLLRAMAGLLPGARLRPAGKAFTLVYEVDGCWLDARAREAPHLEVYVRTLDVPGFELALAPTDRPIRFDVARVWTRDAHGNLHPSWPEAELARAYAAARAALTFDAAWSVERRDDQMAALWLDEPVRAAVLDATWLTSYTDLLGAGAHVGGYQYRVKGGEVLVLRRFEADPERLVAAVRAGGLLAARPHRLARAWRDVARALGGTTTADRWDLGDGFAVTVERGPTTVRIDNVRTLPGEDAVPRLRTRLRARRVAPVADRWAAWTDKVGRPYRPRVGRRLKEAALPDALAGWHAEAADPARLSGRLAAVAPLVTTAAPAALWTSGDELGMWWDHLVMAPERLGPAIELAGRLAVDLATPTGPYR